MHKVEIAILEEFREIAAGAVLEVGNLAFSALLLFVNDWQLDRATAMFSTVANSTGHADPSLGNVIGRDPFHDYEARSKLKRLQECGFTLPAVTDPTLEIKQIEEELRKRLQAK